MERVYFEKFIQEEQGKQHVDWNKLHGVSFDNILHQFCDKVIHPENLLNVKQNTTEKDSILSKFCIVKLNGGLGTSMGCNGPKALIEVRDKLNFLDIALKQTMYIYEKYDVVVPIILMDSFYTHNFIENYLKQHYTKFRHFFPIMTFSQSGFHRIMIDKTQHKWVQLNLPEEIDNLYPPGHGEFYHSFYQCGALNILKHCGYEYVFVSNIDNVGATLDVSIANYVYQKDLDFMIEVTKKTSNDIKGGTLVEYDGVMKIMEMSQIHPKHLCDVQNIEKFSFFNTNNIWIKLDAIPDIVENYYWKGKFDLILNPKHIKGVHCIQLETAISCAMPFFNPEKTKAMIVDRKRFIPVKKTSDLLLLRAPSLFVFNPDHGTFFQKVIQLPNIILDDKYYKTIQDFNERFIIVPDLYMTSQLVIKGDFYFTQPDTKIVGNVQLVNSGENKNFIFIPKNVVYHNCHIQF